MESFFPDQRWSSEAEPELGIGIVTGTSKGRVQVHFPISGENRLYAADNAPLRRIRFKPGDTIVDAAGRSLQVERIHEGEELITYLGQGRAMSEADLGNMTVRHGADDRLLMGESDGPELFALRRRTLELDHYRRTSPVNGFVGGRIDLIPHQLYIAHEVSRRYAPRVLLSDEVGLGKTIEACLILHRLLQQGRISRVLILVPESLVHQWFVELLRRFNMWFHIFDEERCAAIEAGAPDGNPFLDDQLVICSTSFLAGSLPRAAQALSAGWDMLVVDEAHHLEWTPEEASPAYAIVEHLSREAGGLLLLTATSEQLGLESHFARLRLLDPDRYTDLEAFKGESINHRQTADMVGKLAGGEPLAAEEMEFLASLLGKSRLQGLEKMSETERNHLIQDLLDQHGPGRVVFRNRRAAMSGFPQRRVLLAPIETEGKEWIDRVSAEFFEEAGLEHWQGTGQPGEKAQGDLALDPRLDWLLQTMKDLKPAKVLLICNRKEKVLALEKAIKDRVKLNVSVFHEDLSLVQRDRNAAWFAEPQGARLMICSEIGSEGRNFQFAHHLILFDLPLQPGLIAVGLLEQRIGRLDRIGQREDIRIHLPYVRGSVQEMLVKWYHEGLGAFQSNLEGGDHVAREFSGRLMEAVMAFPSPEAEKMLATLVADTRTYHENLRATLASGRDRLLEMNSFRPEAAQQVIDQIREEDQRSELESYMLEVFEQYSIDVEDLAPRTYLLHAPQGNAAAFPAIPDEGIGVTFDRKWALSREEMGFLSWDHPMVTGAIDLVLGSGKGSASYAVLPGTGAPAILLEVMFLLETAGAGSRSVDRFLPNSPLRIVVDHTGANVSALYPAQDLDQQLRPGFVDDLLDNEVLVETIFPNMIAAASELAEEVAASRIGTGLKRMRSTMDHEIDRLKTLAQRNNHVRPDEIRIATEERDQLRDLIQGARLRLDALQLIRKG